MDDEQGYPIGVVLAAVGLPEDTVTNWSRRGLVGQLEAVTGSRDRSLTDRIAVIVDWSRNGDAEPALGEGRGKTRRVSFATILRLAVMKAATDLGVSPTRASNWAAVVWMLTASDKLDFKLLHVRRYLDGEESIFPDDELMEAGAIRPDPLLHLTIDVGQITANLRQALQVGAGVRRSTSTVSKQRKPKSS